MVRRRQREGAASGHAGGGRDQAVDPEARVRWSYDDLEQDVRAKTILKIAGALGLVGQSASVYREIPRQQYVDAVDGMLREARQHVS
jgi:hypothetical protein